MNESAEDKNLLLLEFLRKVYNMPDMHSFAVVFAGDKTHGAQLAGNQIVINGLLDLYKRKTFLNLLNLDKNAVKKDD